MRESSGTLTIAETIAAQARERPDAIAIAAPDREPLTFAGLQGQVERTRSFLHGSGLGRDDRVALMVDNGPELAAAFLSLASTLACAPLNPAYRESELHFYLGDLRVSAVVVQEGSFPALRSVAAVLGIPVLDLEATGAKAGLFELMGSGGGGERRDELPEPATTALLLHTSGTTSRPKLVPLAHANLVTSAGNVAASLELTDGDRCLNVMPLFHIHGLVAGVLAPLTSGGTTICAPGPEPERFFDWLESLQPTWYTAVPTMHHAFLSRARSQGGSVASSLRLIRSSSAALPRQVLEGLESAFGCPVIEAYGMTEAAHQMAANPLPPGIRKAGSVGRPSGIEVAILDEAGSQLGRETAGEVAIRGPSVFAGYEANDEANAAAFVDGWFRTGDLGVLDGDGYLTLQGRSKEIINRGGEKVSPLEVEEVLLDHEAVGQAVVFAKPHPTLGEDVAAAVVLRDGAETSERSIREFAAARLADFKVPAAVVLLDELPKGPTGKVQRIGLAERLGLDRSGAPAGTERASPRTQLEHDLVALWKEVLELDEVGVDDDFFALGGDSLVAEEVLAWIAERGHGPEDVSPSVFLWARTVSELADVIERKAWGTPEDVVVVKEGDASSPLFLISGHDGAIVRYGPLVSRLADESACYALVPPEELVGQRVLSIEQIASDYRDTIKRVQPEGPYQLFGRCMGGAVVLEVARQLETEGDEIRFLGMLDPIGEHPGLLRHYWRRFLNFRAQRYLARALVKFVRVRLRRLRDRTVGRETLSPLEHAMLDAGERYSPAPYAGRATLFRTVSYTTPTAFWKAVVTGGLAVAEPVPSSPIEQFEALAGQLDLELAATAAASDRATLPAARPR